MLSQQIRSPTDLKSEQAQISSANSPSTPATPPFSSSHQGSTVPSTSTPSPRPTSTLNDESTPKEGLNGSNVPGLPPPSSASNKSSVPSSRRTSGMPDDMTSSDQARLASSTSSGASSATNRRSINGNLNDITASFDRMGLANKAQQQQQQQAVTTQSPLRSPSGRPSPSATPSMFSNASGGQQSLLQRAVGHPQQAVSQQNRSAASLEQYNLNEDDNSFPVLIRHDSHPGMLSASSAALDLAPLSQAQNRFPRDDGNSEWPQFAQRDGVDSGSHQNAAAQSAAQPGLPHGGSESFDRFGARRGGRSERNSPRMSGPGRSGHMPTAPVTPVSMGRSNDSSLPRNTGPGGHFNSGNGNRQSSANFHDGSNEQAGQKAGRNQDAIGNADSAFSPFGMGGYPGDVKRAGPGAMNAAKTAALGNGYGMGPEPLGSSVQINAGVNGAKTPRKGELDTSTPLEEMQGEIFALCKDQHGCRYLQKKLEEGNPSYRDMIFTETFNHFAELMTDPFGNYLCQKMLEFCTDEQRNLIVESVAPDLVNISLNMHGTRAVQKTIDFLSTPRQIHSIIMALGMNVVPLIKDLNGNHVIQKCLNRLGSSDNQFIYDAVATHCIEVATHRHGCCVLQRCIDHASEKQRMQLVQEITYHALTLVQDPFGNYVVQYILDLNDSRYSEALIRQFVGHVCNLSVQKFSSNVIEKCIRVSEPGVRKQLIEELLNRQRLEKLLRDSFANYVVQTSLDYADPHQRMQLVECIKPILPMIRNTPYGKRIQSKLQRDNIDLGTFTK
ncbi:hypothetical protein L7F22_039190 [Adiantum nelumboides]|nr:hypothetical protein [Adiantum nelumboides]